MTNSQPDDDAIELNRKEARKVRDQIRERTDGLSEQIENMNDGKDSANGD